MKRLQLLPLFFLAACGTGDPVAQPTAHPETFVANSLDEAVAAALSMGNYTPSDKALAARAPGNLGTQRAPLVTQEGEIIVVQGGPQTVTEFEDGSYGLVLTNQVQNPMAVAQEIYQTYPDEFDAITVFTTFPDQGSQGSVAWYLGIRSSVLGIGAQPVDSGSFWGSGQGGKLHGFINMQYIGKYGDGLGNSTHPIHAVMAQEFGHRWSAFLQYADANGQASDAMLGRDSSHWSTTLQANGSVMDGNEWVETDTGDFWLRASNFRFSELDQYTMGLRGPEEVPDWFVIQNATYQGQPVASEWPLPTGVTIQGEREDINIDQVIAVHGPRVPDHIESPKDFRLAVVLVTRPDEDPATLSAALSRMEDFRNTFEQVANDMSDGRMRVCTQASAPCDSAGVTLDAIHVSEHEGNGDDVLEPGETVAIEVTVKSTGFGDAPDVTAELGEPNIEGLNVITPEVSLGAIAQGETAVATEPLLVKIPPNVGCGAEVILPLLLKTDGRTFPARVQFDVGIRALVIDGLEKPDEWVLDPYGTDDATGGHFAIASPTGVDALYTGANVITQPSQDHTLAGVNALVTGPEGGQIGEHDVDDGATTALSPVYDLTGARDPILSWYAWHASYDFNALGGTVPMDNDALYVEASADEGATWVLLMADTSNEQQWIRHDVRLGNALELTGSLQLRFTMIDDDKQTVAEAAVDDILIWDESLVCRPDLADPPADGQGDDGGGDDAGDGDSATDGGEGDADGGSDSGGDTSGADGGEEVVPASDSDGCTAGPQPNVNLMILIAQALGLVAFLRRRKGK